MDIMIQIHSTERVKSLYVIHNPCIIQIYTITVPTYAHKYI